MSLFLVQNRTLKLVQGEVPRSFPTTVTAKITFGPEDAFGLPADNRTTGFRARPASLLWDANEGIARFEGPLIEKIETRIQIGSLTAEFRGNELKLNLLARSFDAASKNLVSANQLMPALMSKHLGTYVWIKSFVVNIGSAVYRFEVSRMVYSLKLSTGEQNASALRASITDWLNCKDHHRRYYSALYYFRHAQRLARLQPDSDSMLAEVILNLTKSLEIVFGSTENRDSMKARAQQWGFPEAEIEALLIPLVLLRSQLDVAHVATGPLSEEERQIVLDFTSAAMQYIGKVLTRIFEGTTSGSITLEPIPSTLGRDKARLLRRIRSQLEAFRRSTLTTS